MQESVKKDRDKYIGGSDIPVIMELSPFKTRYNLLLEKAGVREDSFEGNIYTEYGNNMEEKIRSFINTDIPEAEQYREGKEVYEPKEEGGIGIRIHTDGENDSSILEIKTTSEIFQKLEDYKLYLVQILFYMMQEEKDTGFLAIYERPEDLSLEFDKARLHLYQVNIEEFLPLCEEISSAIIRFMEDLKKVKENPFIQEEELLPAEIPDITNRIIAFEYQLALMKEIEAKLKAEKARLKKAMELSNVKSWKTPLGYKITLSPDGEDQVEEVTIFEDELLKKELPDIYNKYIRKEKVTKKGRAGYVKITAPRKKEG